MTQRCTLILPAYYTCVKSQGGFCSQSNDEDKPLLFFQNSMSFDQKLNLNTDQKIFYSRKTELSASEKHMLENALKYARQVNEMPTSLYG